jgi:hypothetical protein
VRVIQLPRNRKGKPPGAVTAVGLSPDSRTLIAAVGAAGLSAESIRWFDLTTGGQLHEEPARVPRYPHNPPPAWTAELARVTRIGLSTKGPWISWIELYTPLDLGRGAWRFIAGQQGTASLAFARRVQVSPDDRWLLAVDSENEHGDRVTLWDLADALRTRRPSPEYVRADLIPPSGKTVFVERRHDSQAVFAAGGSVLAVTDHDYVCRYDLARRRYLPGLRIRSEYDEAVGPDLIAAAPRGPLLVGTTDEALYVWDATPPARVPRDIPSAPMVRPLRSVPLKKGKITALAFHLVFPLTKPAMNSTGRVCWR